MDTIKLDGPAEHALSSLQDTKLSPMEEALFRSWATANQIEKPDNADDNVDYRGIYKQSQGKVLPHGQLEQIAKTTNSEQTLKRVLHQRMKDAIEKQKAETEATEGKMKQNAQKAEQQAETTKQKLMLRAADEPRPNELKSKKLDLEGKKLDIEKLLVARQMQKEKPAEGPK